MHLSRVVIGRVRNLADAVLEPSPACNLLWGPNASGKTSVLEAIHILSLGRSFRTAQARHVIQRGAEGLTVFGLVRRQDGQEISLGIERNRESARIRIGGSDVGQVAELAARLPVQVLTPEGHRLLEQGPRYRRQFLDWGVFHVEHGFLDAWRRYHRALQQRNAALRARAGNAAITAWDQSLCDNGQKIGHLRTAYLERLRPLLQTYGRRLLGAEAAFEYRAGWPEDQEYRQALAGGLTQDREAGFTRLGPHRADVVIKVDGATAQAACSRGQQKLLVSAMRLAQVALLNEVLGEPCVVLVDDLPAELDPTRRAELLAMLRETGGQVFLTSTEAEALDLTDWPDRRMFHVEQGRVLNVV